MKLLGKRVIGRRKLEMREVGRGGREEGGTKGIERHMSCMVLHRRSVWDETGGGLVKAEDWLKETRQFSSSRQMLLSFRMNSELSFGFAWFFFFSFVNIFKIKSESEIAFDLTQRETESTKPSLKGAKSKFVEELGPTKMTLSTKLNIGNHLAKEEYFTRPERCSAEWKFKSKCQKTCAVSRK